MEGIKFQSFRVQWLWPWNKNHFLVLYSTQRTYLSAIKISTKNKNKINCEYSNYYSRIHQALRSLDNRCPDIPKEVQTRNINYLLSMHRTGLNQFKSGPVMNQFLTGHSLILVLNHDDVWQIHLPYLIYPESLFMLIHVETTFQKSKGSDVNFLGNTCIFPGNFINPFGSGIL